jgi:hypothetical protein
VESETCQCLEERDTNGYWVVHSIKVIKWWQLVTDVPWWNVLSRCSFASVVYTFLSWVSGEMSFWLKSRTDFNVWLPGHWQWDTDGFWVDYNGWLKALYWYKVLYLIKHGSCSISTERKWNRLKQGVITWTYPIRNTFSVAKLLKTCPNEHESRPNTAVVAFGSVMVLTCTSVISKHSHFGSTAEPISYHSGCRAKHGDFARCSVGSGEWETSFNGWLSYWTLTVGH